MLCQWMSLPHTCSVQKIFITFYTLMLTLCENWDGQNNLSMNVIQDLRVIHYDQSTMVGSSVRVRTSFWIFFTVLTWHTNSDKHNNMYLNCYTATMPENNVTRLKYYNSNQKLTSWKFPNIRHSGIQSINFSLNFFTKLLKMKKKKTTTHKYQQKPLFKQAIQYNHTLLNSQCTNP